MSRSSNSSVLSDWYEKGIDFRRSTLRLIGDIDEQLAELAITGITLLDQQDKDISVILMSNGGCVDSGMAIFDAIKLCKNNVTIAGTGYVDSMATVIMQAADERLLTEHCRFMVHMGEADLGGHPVNLERWHRDYKRWLRWAEELFLEKIREVHEDYRPSQVKKLLQFDSVLTAQEAVELGLADRVIE